MRLVGLQPVNSDHVHWQLTVPPEEDEHEVSIFFNLRSADVPARVLHYITQYNEISWLSPIPDSDDWMLDMDALKKSFPGDYFPMDWLTGKIRVYPNYRAASLAGTSRTGVEFAFDSSTQKSKEQSGVKITYIPHALDDMKERDISDEVVRWTLEEPDVEYQSYKERIVAERTPEGRRLAFKVVYNLGLEGERVVVAVMRGRPRRTGPEGGER